MKIRNLNNGRFKEFIHINPDMKFGMLTVLYESLKRYKNRCKFYTCKCDCGTIKDISRMSLVTRATKSCGCLNRKNKRLNPGVASWNSLFYVCKRSAEIRDIEFKINKIEHKNISSGNCYYCGSPPIKWSRYIKSNGSVIGKINQETLERSFILTNGIDRINNTIGYIVENCVPCCYDCNEMKMDRTKKDFLSHIYKISSFQEKKYES